MLLRILTLPLLAVAIAGAACSSNSSNGGTGDGGLLLPDGAPIGNGPAGGAAKPGGNITIFQSQKSGDFELTISVLLTDGATVDQANGCQVQTDGDCKVSICDKNDGGVAASSNRSAGVIQVSGLLAPASLTPKDDKSYDSYSASSSGKDYIPPGASIQVKAAGAEIPAFETSVTAGAALTVTEPQVNQLFMATLPKGDAVIAWTGNAPSDHVQVSLSANAASDGAKTATATCLFTGSGGRIPKNVLDALSSNGAIAIGSFNTTVAHPGGYDVAVNVWRPERIAIYNR
jgi:hypothetical protein